jgi:hypothetical protein
MLFFLRGNLNEPKTKNPFEWLSEVAWQDLDGLINLSPTFKSLFNDVRRREDEWRVNLFFNLIFNPKNLLKFF